MSDNLYVIGEEDGGETWAARQIEMKIRDRASQGLVPGSTLTGTRFNGVIITSPLLKEILQDGRIEYYRLYTPIIYDPEQYQASLTDYQRDLKRSIFRKDSKKEKNNVPYDEIGFFTMENKPDEYETLFSLDRPAEMWVNEREDGGSSESWASLEIEKRIRNEASQGIHGGSNIANAHYNGVLLVGELKRSYDEYNGSSYVQYYIPINYDHEKYQAPLTDYQRGLKRSVFRRKK